MEEVCDDILSLSRRFTATHCVPAGQSGLVQALASAFIDWSRESGLVAEDYVVRFPEPSLPEYLLMTFKIDWVKGDTTESINFLQSGDADIAITYNSAAERRAIALGTAIRREYGFRDHFYLVGPL